MEENITATGHLHVNNSKFLSCSRKSCKATAIATIQEEPKPYSAVAKAWGQE
jgi:hypothetical protein